MSTEAKLHELIKEYDIFVSDQCISKDLLLDTYSKFVSEIIGEEYHSIGVCLHIGSVCFAVISILYSALSCIAFDNTTPEMLVATLQPGDKILFDNCRAIFQGIDFDGNIRLEQENSKQGKKIPCYTTAGHQNYYKIKRYNGKSDRLDSRGIRNDKGLRSDFIRDIFGKTKDEITSTTQKHVIIVANRMFSDCVCKNTVIKNKSGTKSISLSELFTAAYYSSDSETFYSGNAGKTEPVIKFVNSISLAREMIISDEEHTTIGLVVIGKMTVDAGRTEICSLLDRPTLRYAFVCYNIAEDDNRGFVEMCSNVKLIAYTEEMLLSYYQPVENSGILISNLHKKANNILYKKTEEILVANEIALDRYILVKRCLYLIRKEENSNDEKEYFIIHAYSLLTLFTNAVFPIKCVEILVSEGSVSCLSPKQQLDQLEKIAAAYLGLLGDRMKEVMFVLSEMYISQLLQNNKYNYIQNRLENSEKNEKILLIVPKEYYSEVLVQALKGSGINTKNLNIESVNSYNSENLYDQIIVSGVFSGKFQNIFSYNNAPLISILQYPLEKNSYEYYWQSFLQKQEFYNENSSVKYEYEVAQHRDISEDKEKQEILFDKELSSYIDSLYFATAIKYGENRSHSVHDSKLSDIVRIAKCCDNEIIYFTKHYISYRLDFNNSLVSEAGVESLVSGDKLLFTKNTDEAKDIVDVILDEMCSIENNDLCEEYRKSKYWKIIFKEYVTKSQLSLKSISEQMANYGQPKHEVTLRSWLSDECHTVGPRELDTFYQLALICDDKEMQKDPESFFAACNAIRSLRIRILELIGVSIVNNFNANGQSKDYLSRLVAEKVSSISQVIQIDSIKSVTSIKVPAHLTNRPFVVR